jgi:hypothetical protein
MAGRRRRCASSLRQGCGRLVHGLAAVDGHIATACVSNRALGYARHPAPTQHPPSATPTTRRHALVGLGLGGVPTVSDPESDVSSEEDEDDAEEEEEEESGDEQGTRQPPHRAKRGHSSEDSGEDSEEYSPEELWELGNDRESIASTLAARQTRFLRQRR